MKEELIQIISKEYQNLKDLSELVSYASEYIDAIEKQRLVTTNKFKTLLEKYNFETISIFSEYPEYPYFTLFKGVDSWTLCPVIDYEGGVGDMDDEIGILFTDPELYPSFENEELEDLTWTLNSRIILTWLSSIWQSIDGPSYGIVVKTLENNSSSGFIFNDLAWDDLSSLNHYNDKTKPTGNYFNSSLSTLDIYQRVKLETYPVYPYQNKWRFFKNGDVVKEFVSYGNETGQKLSTENIKDLNIQKHPDLFNRLKFELEQTNKFIEDGYIEFIPEEPCRTPIYEGAIETKFHSGQHWYTNELNDRLEISQIESIERQYKIILPFHFKHYLRLFNGRKYNNINLNFPIGNGKHLKIKEFFNLEELEIHLKGQSNNSFLLSLFKKKSNQNNWIAIGTTADDKSLIIDLESSIVGIKESDEKINSLDISFEEFIKEPINY